ncbi:MAG: SusD/RagB family nutrient-binding outer membrane lipoprotein [Tannerellaceae bacterium]|nr:SusD/RagB family nutrient-binding outer membrane lipoprotein [Tannerellaceae bacterium]
MNRYIYSLLAIIATLISYTSCINLEEMNMDPNNPTETSPALLLTNLSYATFSESKAGPCLAGKMMVLTSGESTEQVFKWNRGSFDYYNRLRNTVKMREEATKSNENAYEALALFFQAHYFYSLTMQFGDIPCSEALKAETEAIYQPRYDTQESVLEKVLNDLDEANSLLKDNNSLISGDIIYNGDLLKWRRLINAYRLKVLITLSNKTKVGNITVAAAFKKVAENEPLMTGTADNGQLVFLDQQDNRYVYFNDSDFGSGRYMDSTYIAAFRLREDPRLFAIATQTPEAGKQGLPVNDFSGYDGGDPAVAYSLVNIKAGQGLCSKPATRYYQNPVNEPMILLGYTEQQLILAEGIVRGWITGNDKELYESAVKASFDFYATHVPAVEGFLSQIAAEQYLQGHLVVYSSALTKEEKIERIIMQKYLPSFLQGGMWSRFYDYLRTGYPELRVPEGTVIPFRWMYPQDEYNNNAANVEAALKSQFGGADRTTDKPWWITP